MQTQENNSFAWTRMWLTSITSKTVLRFIRPHKPMFILRLINQCCFLLLLVTSTFILRVQGHACKISYFSHDKLTATLWTVARQLLCPWASPGKNTGMGAMPSSTGSSRPRKWTWVFCITGRFFTAKPPGKPCSRSLSTNNKPSLFPT